MKSAFGVAYLNKCAAHIRRFAIKEGHDFQLTKEQVIEWILQDCHWCGRAPYKVRRIADWTNGSFPVNGLDRLDSSKGYVTENIVPCCTQCNKMKTNHTAEHFVSLCRAIADRHPKLMGLLEDQPHAPQQTHLWRN